MHPLLENIVDGAHPKYGDKIEVRKLKKNI